jgi:TATA-box binding protein (TBP) (component of TFIID and TFIIIB)
MIPSTMRGKIFSKALEDTQVLSTIPDSRFKVVNVVSKVDFLEPGEMFVLKTIAISLSGMAKYQPKRFAAVILHAIDSVGSTACLVFQPGKVVIVGAATEYHAMYAAQSYRLILENIVSAYKDPDTDRIGLYSLEGRTQFTNWHTWNMVVNAKLENRPNLKNLVDALGDVSNWNPELFPALKMLIWLRPKDSCTCKSKKRNKSCNCNSKSLIFDTGKMVITGCKNTHDLNLSFHRISSLLDQNTDMHETDELLPRNQRFKARQQKMLVQHQQKTQVKMDNNISTIDYIERKYQKKRPIAQVEDETLLTMHPFVRACVLGQIENTRHMLGFYPGMRGEALEAISKLPPDNQNTTIIQMLSKRV